jgi:H+/Cl- antiporter ClcA
MNRTAKPPRVSGYLFIASACCWLVLACMSGRYWLWLSLALLYLVIGVRWVVKDVRGGRRHGIDTRDTAREQRAEDRRS